MTTAKAPYSGGARNDELREFSPKLKSKLRTFVPVQRTKSHQTSQHLQDAFVSALWSEACWVAQDYDLHKRALTKQQIRAEQEDLLSHLRSLHIRLEKMSPDLDRLLPCSDDQSVCIESITNLIGQLEDAGRSIDLLPTRRKISERQQDFALYLTARILPILKHFGLSVAATSHEFRNNDSDAVQILNAIGDDIGLPYSEKTWRDLIIEAKSQKQVETTGDKPWHKFFERKEIEHSFGTRGDGSQSSDIGDVSDNDS